MPGIRLFVLDCKRSPAVRTPDAVLSFLGQPVSFSTNGWSAILSVLGVGIGLLSRRGLGWRGRDRESKLSRLGKDQRPHGLRRRDVLLRGERLEQIPLSLSEAQRKNSRTTRHASLQTVK